MAPKKAPASAKTARKSTAAKSGVEKPAPVKKLPSARAQKPKGCENCKKAKKSGKGTECFACEKVFCDSCFDGEGCNCCDAEPMCGTCIRDCYDPPEYGEGDGYYCESCKDDPEIVANP